MNLPQKQKMESEEELRKLSSQFLKEIKELEQATTWVLVDEEPCSVYTINIGDRVANKLVLIINLPFQTVLDFIAVPDNISKISEQKLQTKILYEKDNLRVMHTMIEGFWPISDRDMVILNTVKSDGTKAYLGSKSCNFSVKEDPDIVRMEVVVSGTILEKLDEKHCKFTSISDIDIKGSIPNFIKNSIATRRATAFAKLEKTIRKSLS